MLERVPPAEAERVRALLRRRTLETAEIEDIRRLVLEAEGVEYARAARRPYARAAKARSGGCSRPPRSARSLSLVADFVVDRDR